MSFLLENFDVPLWFLVFALACAAPLWIKWYKWFYRKFIVTGRIQKTIQEVSDIAEEKANVLKKATDNWNTRVDHDLNSTNEKKAKPDNLTTEEQQPYVKIVLKTLAVNGDAGMLIQSIADKLKLGSNEIKGSLLYLEKNKFVEVVTAGSGTKYYLSPRGKQYSIKQGYITE